MLAFLEGPELVIVLVIVLLVFGGSKIPQLARSLGQAQKEFQNALHDGGQDHAPDARTVSGGPTPRDRHPGDANGASIVPRDEDEPAGRGRDAREADAESGPRRRPDAGPDDSISFS
jgi:sec-independent protein translocase protein TatA